VLSIEALESRVLLSVTVNAAAAIRVVPTNAIGVNTAPWDGNLSSAQTLSLTEAAGIDTIRLGGGSYVDGSMSSDSTGWHFNINNQSTTIGQMALYAQNLGATVIVDVNYGTASPQEAEALWAYLDGSVTDTTPIAGGEEWLTSATSWTQNAFPAETVGYWASLRAAPLNSGSFLDLNHPAPFNFTTWEMGNEVYGSTWEMDMHGSSGDTLAIPSGDTRAAHDPTTLIAFSNDFETAINGFLSDGMESAAKPISVGLDSQDVATGSGDFSDWIGNILTQSVAQKFTLGFIADHYYTPVSSGKENDAELLAVSNATTGSKSNPYWNSTNPYDWTLRATDYDTDIHNAEVAGGAAGTQYLGNVQLIADEVNSVAGTPNMQSTNLVNGLFIADAIGSAFDTTGADGYGGYQGIWVWDLHNGPYTISTESGIYGWRTGSDYGILGSGGTKTGGGSGTTPPIPDNTNEPYPDYFALQLASKIYESGGTIVSASLDTTNKIDAYAVMEANGHLELLVINENSPGTTPPNNLPDPTLTEQFNLSGFTASGSANVWKYGVAEDDAQAASSTGAAALTNFSTNLTISGGSFSYALPDYSMMVFDLSPQVGPTVAKAAAANPNLVEGTSNTTALSALGAENGSDSGLTYTWSASGPAGVTYTGNTNGTNAAKSISANFTSPGNYTFLVTITDSSNLTITSSVAVTVENFAVASGTTLNVNLSGAGPVALSSSGGNITASQNGVQVSFAGMTSMTVTDNASGDVLNISGSVAVPFTFVNCGSSTVNISGGAITFAAAPSGSIDLGTLSESNGAITTITAATTQNRTTLSVNNLSIDSSSTLDVTNNEVLINYGSAADPIGSIAAWIVSGDAGGAWNGTGIISTVAAANANYGLGYADAADANNPAALASGQIEILYTLLGDANLDGAVNGSDFAILSANFNKAVSGWDEGDFNYDGSANGTDFAALSANFNQGSQIAVAATVPAVTILTPVSNASAAVPLTQTVLSSGSSKAALKRSERQALRHDGHKA